MALRMRGAHLVASAIGPGANWLWRRVVLPSWLSLLSAPLVVAGYLLLGTGRPEGWLFLIASQFGLLGIAVVNRQYGLFVAVVPMAVAAHNFLLLILGTTRP